MKLPYFLVTPADLSQPEWDALHLRFLAPWHHDDLHIVKVFIALRRKRGLPIRWERVEKFNRNENPDYFLECDQWRGVMRQVQSEVDALSLRTYSWESLPPAGVNKESARKQRWRLKKKSAKSNISGNQGTVDIDPRVPYSLAKIDV